MKTYSLSSSAWVSEDGSYGVGSTLLFDENDLTPSQWEEMSELPDYQRLAYVYDCIKANKSKS